MQFIPRTLPSITEGKLETIKKFDPSSRIIIQEKVDGSQLTIFKRNDTLHFYNKNNPCNPKGKPWLNSYISLINHPEFFQDGYFYHGEAMKDCRPVTCIYQRVPRYHWTIYEIIKSDGTILTPEEMIEHLKLTNLETVQILYDSKIHLTNPFDIESIILELMKKVETGEISSSLGGKMEGIVVKRLNYNGSTYRGKFVRKEFQEAHRQKKEKITEVPMETFIQNIGEIYNTEARKRKAMQHLKEKEKWNDINMESNITYLVNELDEDLLKEAEMDIKNMLFIRFWPEISKNARGDLSSFVKKL